MTDLSDEIQEINLEGFQVVSGDLFTNYTRTSNPTVTLWHNSLSFSKASLTLLNGCERIRVEINPNSKCLLIVPVTIKDKDNIHWVKGIKDPVPRKMECKRFTSQKNNVIIFVTFVVGIASNNDELDLRRFKNEEKKNFIRLSISCSRCI